MNQIVEILPAIVALLVTLACVPLSIYFARKLGVLDTPDARKVHVTATPRLGGIGIITGILSGVLVSVITLELIDYPLSKSVYQQLLAVCGASLFVFGVGLVDDIRSVSSRFKLISLLTAAAMVCGGGGVIGELWFGGELWVNLGWVNWLLTMFWVVAIAVAINFIDGLDGLAGGIALIASSVLAICLLLNGQVAAAIIPLALAGSLIGFLFYNWHPAKTFMGDSGSMTIGFLLAAMMVVANPLIGTMRGVFLPSLALSIPIADTVLTMFRRRYQQRRSIFSAERGHIHHRLLDRGFSHMQAVIFLHAVSLLAVGIGLIALSMEGWSTLGGFALLIPLLWGTFRFAGSVRTEEMVQALRDKRQLDRASRRHRDSFESLQLEFNHVTTISQWWQGVCRAAEHLDFVKVEICFPGPESKSRRLVWESNNPELLSCERLHATIPIAERKSHGASVPATVEVAAHDSLELASERMVLFSRLVTDYSLEVVRKKEAAMTVGSGFDTARNAANDKPNMASSISPGQFGHLRVALVHDFLYTYCGAEKVVEQLIKVFPHCDVYSLFDFLDEDQRGFLQDRPVTTSFIQNLPMAKAKHRAYLPLMPLAIEQLDVSGYDLIVSSSYLAAKGVITGPDQLHVCYCHSPVRYAWDLQHQYLDRAGLKFGPRGIMARAILHYIRNWDVRSALGVDQFIANSNFISRRIEKVYRRKSKVVHPPVDTEQFSLSTQPREDFYLVAGRMVPYKRTPMIVEAFTQLRDRKLVVIGDGPDMEAVRQIAGPNVEIIGHAPMETLVDHMQRAKALVFAAEEDFGIVPVEALSCGTPVIAYNKGGVTESVVDGEHGLFFDEQTPESLIEAIERFETQIEFSLFDPEELHRRSTEFSSSRFVAEIENHVIRWTERRWEVKSKLARIRHRLIEQGLGEETVPKPHVSDLNAPAGNAAGASQEPAVAAPNT
ncbi:MAG: glycosyltransferase [Rhodopirellula sp. JB044]|uniref:glycosyltransferase n=1 Tax=Rhodopirellula sp. JB044 TaxID=3342844 RepID=UPI00370ABC69